jgi:hypothetical protein
VKNFFLTLALLLAVAVRAGVVTSYPTSNVLAVADSVLAVYNDGTSTNFHLVTASAVAGGTNVVSASSSTVTNAVLNQNFSDGLPSRQSTIAIRALINGAARGSNNVYLFCIGDSTTSGFYGANTAGDSWPDCWTYQMGKLSPLVNADGIFDTKGMGSIATSLGNWLISTSPGPFNNDPLYNVGGMGTNAYIYTAAYAANFVTLFYQGSTNGTPWLITTNGVVAATLNSYSATPTNFISTVGFPLSKGMQVGFWNTNTTAGVGVTIYGWTFGVSNSSVCVINSSYPGMKTSDYTNSAWLSGVQLMKHLGNSAVILNVHANDALNNIPLANFETNWLTLASAFMSNGLLLVSRQTPLYSIPDLLDTNGYADFMQNFSAANNLPYFNPVNWWGSYKALTNSGMIQPISSGVHPYGIGYLDMAKFYAKGLDLPDYQFTPAVPSPVWAVLASDYFVTNNSSVNNSPPPALAVNLTPGTWKIEAMANTTSSGGCGAQIALFLNNNIFVGGSPTSIYEGYTLFGASGSAPTWRNSGVTSYAWMGLTGANTDNLQFYFNYQLTVTNAMQIQMMVFQNNATANVLTLKSSPPPFASAGSYIKATPQ